MYLRKNSRKKNGVLYETWSLVESVRTERGPRQRIVANIGKLPGMDDSIRVGWEHIAGILDGKYRHADLFDPNPEPPEWAKVDISSVRVERLRHFGDVFLGLALWRRLGLNRFFSETIVPGNEEVPWHVMACILTLARFCAPSSELHIAESWYEKTALEDLLGVAADKVNKDRLYRSLDVVLKYKEELFRHLQKAYGEMFGITYDILLYDVTSTYFEGAAEANPQARRGYSRDKRPDCVQVCIGLIVTPEGFPIAYEVFSGNRTDVTTVEEIVDLLETKYGKARRIWVMDRGMISEENLEMLRARGAKYLVGTPRSTLRKFEQELLNGNWSEIRPGLEVKTCACPDGTKETYVLCRSAHRKEKENAIRERHILGLEQGLEKLRLSLERGRLYDRGKAERRVGRLFQKYSRASSMYEVQIIQMPETCSHKQLQMSWTPRQERREWAQLSDGAYLLRSNISEQDPKKLWEIYMGLTQVEDSFRITKHDLGLRPVYHQTENRTQAHIMVCFLSLAMWRTLQHWMGISGVGDTPRKLIDEMREVRSMDVVMRTQLAKELRLRVVSKPERGLPELLKKIDLPLPNRPKRIENVVETLA